MSSMYQSLRKFATNDIDTDPIDTIESIVVNDQECTSPIELKSDEKDNQGNPIKQPIDCLFVSTSLEILKRSECSELLISNPDAPEFIYNEMYYRKLTPEYFAWLSNRMSKVQDAFTAGKVSEKAWNKLYEKFVTLSVEAFKIYGQSLKLTKDSTFDADSYLPPGISQTPSKQKFINYSYPSFNEVVESKLPFLEQVTQSSLDKVNEIRDQALANGWKEEQLLQNRGQFRFPCGSDYGLITHLYGNRTVGEISHEYIEIVDLENAHKEVVLKFFNDKATKPWESIVEA